MTTSILNDVKHVLGIGEDVHDFDQDLIMLINSQFATLHQLGVGPGVGFQITGATEQWSDFVDDVRLNSVKSYVYLRVKIIFDPPGTGFVIAAMERQIAELEYRINVVVDYG